MQEVKGKTAFVTGGASGIGYAMAAAFAEAGMKVAIADIDEAKLGASAEELKRLGTSVCACVLDVTDRDAWERAAQRAEQALGAVHVLCNNAGISAIGWNVDEMPPALWDRQIGINLTGAFNGSRCFIPRIKAHGAGGHIVNTASISGLRARGGHAAYIASKHAIVGFSDALRIELKRHGIGVSVLCPGSVKSNLAQTSQPIRALAGALVPPHPEKANTEDPNALDTAWYGRRVLRAVMHNEFFVLSHPEYRDLVCERFTELNAAFDVAERLAAEANYTPQAPH